MASSSDDRPGPDGRRDTTSPLTFHVEPRDQGAKPYLRCPDCEREVIGTYPDRLTHPTDCRYSGVDLDPPPVRDVSPAAETIAGPDPAALGSDAP